MSLIRSFGSALSELAAGVSEHVSDLVRTDGWLNLATGIGTSRDKTEQTCFGGRIPLLDVQLSDLYSFNGLASRVADTYPREEMRLGFGLSGFDPDEITAANKYLRQFELQQIITDARIWGNVYGGSVIWPLIEDGMAPEEPLDLARIQAVLGLRVIDRRWILPETWYYSGAKAGWPEVYRMVQPTQGGSLVTVGLIHETRLIKFPGARTEWLKKLTQRMWDLSVLEKVYDAMRSEGNVWKGIETLVADANQGVFKIKNLWNLVTSDPNQGDDSQKGLLSGPTGKLLKRIAFMDLTRSAGRAIVLDQENETFERVLTQFSGLADLSDRGYSRVAADAEIPVTILRGESPAGLNATGDSDLRWFFGKVEANQSQIVEPRLRQLLRILFAADSAPQLTKRIEPNGKTASLAKAAAKAKQQDEGEAVVTLELEDPIEDLQITWLKLWAATAKELSEINLARAQEAQIWIAAQVLLPEEVALSLGPETGWKFDREAREGILDDNAEELLQKRAEDKLTPPQPPPAPDMAPGAVPPKPGAPPAPPASAPKVAPKGPTPK